MRPLTKSRSKGEPLELAPLDPLGREIQRVLDLIKPQYAEGDEPGWEYEGYCGAASEAYLHLAHERGEAERVRVMRGSTDGASHWWLVDASGRVIDLNLSPSDRRWLKEHPGHRYPYGDGRGAGFRNGPKRPSKRAAAIIELVKSRR
jgi:hypothetical protein